MYAPLLRAPGASQSAQRQQHVFAPALLAPASEYQAAGIATPAHLPTWHSNMDNQPIQVQPNVETASISAEHLNALEKTSAPSMWRQIAQHLRDEYLPQRPLAFSNYVELGEIAKKNSNVDRECLRAMLISWRNRSGRHTVGPLCRVLIEVGLGRISEEVFGVPA